jgi:hypothetical protein
MSMTAAKNNGTINNNLGLAAQHIGNFVVDILRARAVISFLVTRIAFL